MKPFIIKLISLLTVVVLTITAVAVLYPRTSQPVDAKINDNGELVLYYSDGSDKNLGRIEGEQGARGEKGNVGSTGPAGADGQDGVLTIVTDDSTVAVAAAKGLQSAVSIACMQGDTPLSYGSGVIYKYDKSIGEAFIITNYHVVYNESKKAVNTDIAVYLYGSEYTSFKMSAEYVGGSPTNDIAVLHISNSDVLKKSDCAAVTVASPEKLTIGSTAIAVGNAKGYGTAVTSGIVSVDSEYITMDAPDGSGELQFRVMRMDTAVNPGNSGGGLYNASGELIGIVNAKNASTSVENIAYAIPSDLVTAVADNIIDNCYQKTNKYAIKATFGVMVSISNSKAVYDNQTGKVSIVEAIRIAEEPTSTSLVWGKLFMGDVLLSISVGDYARDITRMHHVTDVTLRVRAGDVVEFKILRDGQEQTVSVTVTQNCLSVC